MFDRVLLPETALRGPDPKLFDPVLLLETALRVRDPRLLGRGPRPEPVHLALGPKSHVRVPPLETVRRVRSPRSLVRVRPPETAHRGRDPLLNTVHRARESTDLTVMVTTIPMLMVIADRKSGTIAVSRFAISETGKRGTNGAARPIASV